MGHPPAKVTYWTYVFGKENEVLHPAKGWRRNYEAGLANGRQVDPQVTDTCACDACSYVVLMRHAEPLFAPALQAGKRQ